MGEPGGTVRTTYMQVDTATLRVHAVLEAHRTCIATPYLRYLFC